ncbi:MAG: hypothetical protein Q9191_007053 [Dirinaria sp. TL-2023a]
MGIGKYLHRKKGDSPQQPQRSRATSQGATGSKLGTTRYEATPPGSLPQTGSYPIRGNNSTAANTRPESAPSYPLGNTPTRTEAPPYNDFQFFDQRPPQTTVPRQQQQQNPSSGMDAGLAQGMSGLNISDNAGSDSAAPSPISYYSPSGPGRLDPRVDRHPQTGLGGQNVNRQKAHQQLPSTYGSPSASAGGYSGRYDEQYQNAPGSQVPTRGFSEDVDDAGERDRRRRDSIPRKQIGTSAQSSTSPVSRDTAGLPAQSPTQRGPPVPQHDVHLSQQTPRRDSPLASRQNYPDLRQQSVTPRGPYTNRVSSIGQDRYTSTNEGPTYFAPVPHPTSGERLRNPSAEEIVARAGTNTRDTEVIEKIAPAVTQESVTEKVHHIREEVITREIHTHDVFHRMLPVIDVEVLPPRHFLPVEGGGLVEIGADEVPGRSTNWVIAETASTIASDSSAPTARRRFTAREFPGKEGDEVTFSADEGHEITHTTWVHPPELETGGRDTGQTWPMVFGKDPSSEGRSRTHGQSSSRHAKSRSKKSISTQQGPGKQSMVA